jgi:hypothetical protein
MENQVNSNLNELPNPFFYGGPVVGDMFRNREDELRWIFDRIGKRQSTSIVGERLSGKTSLLKRVKYIIEDSTRRKLYLPPERKIVCVHIDAQQTKSPPDFYRSIFEAVREQSTALLPSIDVPIDPVDPTTLLEKIYSQDVQLVVLADEFEETVKNGGLFTPDDFGRLRGLITKQYISLITGTIEQLGAFPQFHVLSSPFFNVFDPIRIGSFDEGSFDDFVAHYSATSPFPLQQYKDRIVQLAGRFPYFLQLACSLYFEAWRTKIEKLAKEEDEAGKKDVKAWRTKMEKLAEEETGKKVVLEPSDHQRIREQFADKSRSAFKYAWKHLSPEEKKALSFLATLTLEEQAQVIPALARLEPKRKAKLSPLIRRSKKQLDRELPSTDLSDQEKKDVLALASLSSEKREAALSLPKPKWVIPLLEDKGYILDRSRIFSDVFAEFVVQRVAEEQQSEAERKREDEGVSGEPKAPARTSEMVNFIAWVSTGLSTLGLLFSLFVLPISWWILLAMLVVAGLLLMWLISTTTAKMASHA